MRRREGGGLVGFDSARPVINGYVKKKKERKDKENIIIIIIGNTQGRLKGRWKFDANKIEDYNNRTTVTSPSARWINFRIPSIVS